jgi:hypothetical protein
MKFKVFKTSNGDGDESTVFLDTLEELLTLAMKCNEEIIINVKDMSIEIYDTYRE